MLHKELYYLNDCYLLKVIILYWESILYIVNLRCDQHGQQETIGNITVFHEYSFI